ncbi:MAG: HNH endonuclease [Acidobacteria bacterium]|nr:HNH endonuclease [Acidobacteriota bacterium]
MPTAPLRPCGGSPSCRALVANGRCPACARKREQLRGSRHARGYDAAWVRLRAAFLANPDNRHCVWCAAEGRTTPTTEVDHVDPFTSYDDPRRLDRNNLQALCGLCHRRKTASQRTGRR